MRLWVDTSSLVSGDSLYYVCNTDWITLRERTERGKKESIMGNPAGVYMVYMGLRSALTEMDAVKRGEVSVSDERLARQLEAEYVSLHAGCFCVWNSLILLTRYGIDPIPFGREVDKDPESPEGALLTKILLDMTIGG